MVGTLVAMLQQQQHQSAQMLALMGERLERLERERAASSQDTRGAASAAPQSTASTGASTGATNFPAEGKLPSGVETPKIARKDCKGEIPGGVPFLFTGDGAHCQEQVALRSSHQIYAFAVVLEALHLRMGPSRSTSCTLQFYGAVR